MYSGTPSPSVSTLTIAPGSVVPVISVPSGFISAVGASGTTVSILIVVLVDAVLPAGSDAVAVNISEP